MLLDVLRKNCKFIFGQWRWIMMHVSKTGSLTYSLVYLLLRYNQGQGLIQCQKLQVRVKSGYVELEPVTCARGYAFIPRPI